MWQLSLSNGGSKKEAAWMVGMTLYICLECAFCFLVRPTMAESLKRDGPHRAVTRYGLVCPSGFLWWLTAAAAKPPIA